MTTEEYDNKNRAVVTEPTNNNPLNIAVLSRVIICLIAAVIVTEVLFALILNETSAYSAAVCAVIIWTTVSINPDKDCHEFGGLKISENAYKLLLYFTLFSVVFLISRVFS